MPRDGHFWRNVTLITLAHVAVLLGLIRWSVEARSSSNAQSIVWISDAEDLAAAGQESNTSPQSAMIPVSPREAEPLEKDEEAEKTPFIAAAKSEIELPSPTAEPTSTPRPTATPTPSATPKPTLEKTVVAKASPKPSPKAKPRLTKSKSTEKAKKTAANAEKKKVAKPAPAKDGSSSSQTRAEKTGAAGKGGSPGGGSSASEFAWYGNMLHDRFYGAWVQPTTNIAAGTKISTLVKVRIERDGHVSSFEIIKPSENVMMNGSVAAIARRVTQVDPPPTGLGTGDHYDVKINFELNTEQGASN